jgi:hypothetical protein
MADDKYAGLPPAVRAAMEDLAAREASAVPIETTRDVDTDGSSWSKKYLCKEGFLNRFTVHEGDDTFDAYIKFGKNGVRLTRVQAAWRKNRESDDPNKKQFILDFSLRCTGEEIGVFYTDDQGNEKTFPLDPYTSQAPIWQAWRDRPHRIKAQFLNANPSVALALRDFLCALPLSSYRENIDVRGGADGAGEPWLWRVNFLAPSDAPTDEMFATRGVKLAAFEVTDRWQWIQSQIAQGREVPVAENEDAERFFNFYRGVMHTTKSLVEIASGTGNQAERDAMRGAQFSLTGRRSWSRDNTVYFNEKDASIPSLDFGLYNVKDVATGDVSQVHKLFDLRQTSTASETRMTMEQMEQMKTARESARASAASADADQKTTVLTGSPAQGNVTILVPAPNADQGGLK